MASATPIDILCLGGATLDRKYRSIAALVPGTSNPSVSHGSTGGVARNVCETALRLGARAGLSTLVGDDDAGRRIVAELAALGADVSAIRVVEAGRTAEYVAVLDADGSLAFGLADMAIFDRFGMADLERLSPWFARARFVFADCNLPEPVLGGLTSLARDGRFKLAVDPVSVAKSARLPADLSGIDLLMLNRDEAAAMTGASASDAAVSALLGRGAAAVVLTDGTNPILIASPLGATAVPVPPAEVADVTGAGDALIGATLAGLAAGHTLPEAVQAALRIAALTVSSIETVRADLSPQLIPASARSLA